MALDDLINSLEAEAEAELARHRAAQAARAERLRADTEAEAHAIVAAAVAEAEAAARQAAALDAADARATAAATVRQAREEALDTVLVAARTRLASGTDHIPDTGLEALLQEALEVLPAPQQVHVAARDERAVAVLLARAGVDAQIVTDRPTSDGVVLRGGGRRVDNTLDARLESAWPRERARLARAWQAAVDPHAVDPHAVDPGPTVAGARSADP